MIDESFLCYNYTLARNSGVGSNKKVAGIQTGKMSGWGQRPLHMAIRQVWGVLPQKIFEILGVTRCYQRHF